MNGRCAERQNCRRARDCRGRMRILSCECFPRPLRQRCGVAGIPASAGRSLRSDSNADFSRRRPRGMFLKKAEQGTDEESHEVDSPLFTALAVAAGCATQALAQAYPSHPITIIVPFPAGGPTDTLARILGERMSISLGQPVSSRTSPAPAPASASRARRRPRPTATRSASATGPAMSAPARCIRLRTTPWGPCSRLRGSAPRR